MALTMRTSLEIFTNPSDLVILVGMDGEKWGFTIARGPGYHGKLLLDTCGFAENKEEAVLGLKKVLETIVAICMKELENPVSIPCQDLNPDVRDIDQSKVLNPELIAQILDILRLCDHVRTYEFSLTS